MENKINKEIIIINVLLSYLGIKNRDCNEILSKKENKYILILLLKRYNCLNKKEIKEILQRISDRSLKYNIEKAEEKFLINKEFRELYLEIEEHINKIIWKKYENKKQNENKKKTSGFFAFCMIICFLLI